jgi:hypothetical protein
MEQGDLLFVIWWYGVGGILAVATWQSLRGGGLASFDHVLKILLIGVAAALALYLAPSGIASIQSPADFKLRFFAALAIAWLAGMQVLARQGTEAGMPALALAGFIGVNAPPLALVLSATMVCGGGPSCI